MDAFELARDLQMAAQKLSTLDPQSVTASDEWRVTVLRLRLETLQIVSNLRIADALESIVRQGKTQHAENWPSVAGDVVDEMRRWSTLGREVATELRVLSERISSMSFDIRDTQEI